MQKKHQLTNNNGAAVFDDYGSLTLFRSHATGWQLCLNNEHAIWRVVLRMKNGQRQMISAREVKPFIQRRAPLQLEFAWHISRPAMAVTAQVQLDEQAVELRWNIIIHNHSNNAIWEVQYPRIGGLSFLSRAGRHDYLLFPWQCGLLIPNPIEILEHGKISARSWISEYAQCDEESRLPKIAYNYPGMLAMQLLAFYDKQKKRGIYYATEDGAARFKQLGFYRVSPCTASLSATHFPDDRLEGKRDYGMPYQVVTALFQGDWPVVAQRYRQWAVRQPWCSAGRVAERRDIPRWLKENDCWFWNWASHIKDGWNAMPEMLAPAVVALKQKLGCNLAVHWYGSNGEQFNLRNPELFDLGKTKIMKLHKGLALLHAHNIPVIPYLNPRLCDVETATWQKCRGWELACRTETGKIHEETYIPGKSWVTICPTTRRWHSVIKNIVKECAQHGYDGVYVDQISACYAVPCFERRHGHPAGGGNTWSKGNRQLMSVLRAIKKKQPDFAFTSESTIECYHDVMDANLSLLPTRVNTGTLTEHDRPVPLSQAVYHDYNMTYGSYIKLKDDPPDLVYLAAATALINGNQLCFEQYTLDDVQKGRYQAYLDYFRRLCQFRKKYRPYFNLGKWQIPPEIIVKKVLLRLSNTITRTQKVAAVLAGCWEWRGNYLVYLINHTAQTQEVHIKLRQKMRRAKIPPRMILGWLTKTSPA